MRIKKKILLIFCITALLFLTSLGGIILYFYTHPSAVKPFIEKSISRSTGISLTINDLSYSLKPLRILAEGVILKPGEDLPGFHMEILDLKADINLEGPFGRKTLTFNNFRIDGLSFELSKGMTLPKKMPQGKEPSLFDRILKGAIGLFLFRDIKFHAAELVRGDVTIQIADQKLKIHSIRANLNPKHLIEITCAAQMKWPSKRLNLSIPHLKITTDRAISFVEPKIGALLMAQEV
ncbi:MAG: hypothetical protein JRI43_06725, partial [Deltaproteobacteria bacterium]|nr:hypothetical protein [Deltaproteobacteria bacterium]